MDIIHTIFLGLIALLYWYNGRTDKKNIEFWKLEYYKLRDDYDYINVYVLECIEKAFVANEEFEQAGKVREMIDKIKKDG